MKRVWIHWDRRAVFPTPPQATSDRTLVPSAQAASSRASSASRPRKNSAAWCRKRGGEIFCTAAGKAGMILRRSPISRPSRSAASVNRVGYLETLRRRSR